MSNENQEPPEKIPAIGFHFEQVGTLILPDGREVPNIDAIPNDLEAHRRLMDWLERSQ